MTAGLFKEADELFNRLSVNDFYSFTKNNFANGTLINLSHEKAQHDSAECDAFQKRLYGFRNENKKIKEEDAALLDAIDAYCNYVKTINKHYYYKFSVTHNTCPLPYIVKTLSLFPRNSSEEKERYLMLLSQLPEVLVQMRRKLVEQKERGVVIPKEGLELSVSMFDGLRQGSDSLLKRGFTSETEKMVADYNSELNSFITYLQNDYSDEIKIKALWEDEGGKEYYQSLIEIYTSSSLSPKEIHEIGLSELENTRSKQRDILKLLGKSSDNFLEALQNDRLLRKMFYDSSPAMLQNRLDGYLDRTKTCLSDYFHRLPKTPCLLKRIDPAREGSTSWGYYAVPVGEEVNGIYYYSAAELDKRCQIRTAAIVFHELFPGHHLQVSLIAEDEKLPKMCREHFNTAFADGWAEYAADLANEMGLYNLYELYGRYMWDEILCVRLVVDTAVNGLGWPIEKIRSYMRENTSLNESEIRTESLRYAVDNPGQALAYKMGSLHMRKLRVLAEKEEGFDIRDFHDALLRYGSIPLTLAEKNIRCYINRIKSVK